MLAWQKAAESLARMLYRRPEETRSLTADGRSARAKLALFAVLAGVLALLVAAMFGVELRRWENQRVEVAIPWSEWRVVLGESPAKCAVKAQDPSCLANPANATLWASPLRRTDPEHSKRLLAQAGKYFWIGAELGREQLARARDLGANNLIVGWFNGTYRIWVDGELYVSSSWRDREPVIIPLPEPRLAETHRPLRLAVEILHDVYSAQPDNLPGLFGTGLATKHSANGWRRLMSFWTEVRPLVLLSVNLVLGLLFFLLWLTTREKQEYFYMAMYALATACMHLPPLHMFQRVLGRDAENFFNIAFRLHVTGFGLLLGLAFARARRSIFTALTPFVLLVPFAVAWYSSEGFRPYRMRDEYSDYAAMVAYFVGAAACWLQAWVLAKRGGASGASKASAGAAYVPVRIRRLVAFGLGLLALLFFTYLQRSDISDIQMKIIITRVGHLGVLIIMAAIAFREYRQERKLLEKTPVSEYHRRPELPASVAGALLVVDLKNSEALFRAGARLGRAGEFVDECLGQLWTAACASGGVVLASEGDALTAFFDADTHRDPEAAAMQAARAMASKLRLVEEKLRGQDVLDTGTRLGFRGAVSRGEIRPVWHEVGESRYAAWVEAGNSNAFVDAARLMDLERQVEGGLGTCRVIKADPTGLELKGKHDKAYRVAITDVENKPVGRAA